MPAQPVAELTLLIEQTGAPAEQVLNALLDRAAAYNEQAHPGFAISDCFRVLNHPEANSGQIAVALLTRGMAYLNLNKYEQTREDFALLLAMPDLAPTVRTAVIANRGVLHLRTSNFHAAIEDAAKALEAPNLTPEQLAMLYDTLANAQAGTEAHSLALDTYAKLEELPLPPNFPLRLLALQGRGNILLKQGKYCSALAEFAKAIQSPEPCANYHANVLLGRAACYRKLNRPEAEAADLNTAITEFSGTLRLLSAPASELSGALLGRAECYHRLNRLGDAMADWEKVLKLPGMSPKAVEHAQRRLHPRSRRAAVAGLPQDEKPSKALPRPATKPGPDAQAQLF